MNARLVHLLFFISGSSGLIYQVVWVRQFGNLFGNTSHSAALVTGVFMGGLGLGSWLVGRWADGALARGRSMLRTYGYFEVAIGVIGALIAILLPVLGPLSATLSGYTVGPEGWHEPGWGVAAVRYAVALLLLLPITTLMGGTLPLLIRYVLSDSLIDVGWKVGLLYGINTLGAALGALSVDFFFIPALGLFAAQSMAVLINLAVGVIALRMTQDEEPVAAAPPAPAEAPADGGTPAVVRWTALAILISGFGAMGMEMVWFRYLRTALGGYRATFSLLLAVMLCGMWLGSVLAGVLERRFGRPVVLYVCSQCLFVVLTLVGVLTYREMVAGRAELMATYEAASDATRSFLNVWAMGREVLWVVALPSIMMGFAYPLGNAIVQRVHGEVGGRAGGLYLANTVGAVAGSTVAGFVLIPVLGMQHSVLLLCGVSLAATLPLLAAGWRQVTSARVGAALVAATVALAAAGVGYLATRPAYYMAQPMFEPNDRSEKLLMFNEGLNETIVITETPGSGERWLYTDNHSMSATNYTGLRYMRAFSHVPLLTMDSPERVLVICFGVGNTVHAASLHDSVKSLHIADLSKDVLRSNRFFERWNRGVLRDPRVSVFVNDGRQHLRTQPEGAYDLITLEPPPITHAGIASLYSLEFYQLAYSRLSEGGYLTQWLPAYQTSDFANRAMIRAFVDAFPGAIMLSGIRSELILVGKKGGPPTLDLDRVAQRLRERPAVFADLQAIDLGTPMELVGMFAASNETLRAATEGVPPLSDDLPLNEYSRDRLGQVNIPPDIFDTSDWAIWCPQCAEQPELVRDLEPYFELLTALYRAPAFLTFGSTVPSKVGPRLAVTEDHERVWDASKYLQFLYPGLKAQRTPE